MNEHAPLLPVTAASAPRRKNWVALIAAAAVVSFGLADGAPGDAGGTEPFWPRFESGSMKRVIIGNSTRVESFVSEACDLWKEVDTAKLQGLVMGFLMNSNSSTPPG